MEAVTAGNTRPLYEHLVLIEADPRPRKRIIQNRSGRSVQTLEGAPLGMEQLALRLGTDVYHLDTSRLEREGILLRSVFTPTGRHGAVRRPLDFGSSPGGV